MHANATLTPLTRAKMVAHFTSHGGSLRATAASFHSSSTTPPHRRRARTPHPRPAPRAAHLRPDPHRPPPRLPRHFVPRAAPPRPPPPGQPRTPKPPPIRYEHPHPGDLLHLDIKKLGRFARPGVRATGDRTQRNPGAGVESLHVAIDDHSRLGFACLLPDERTPSVLAALRQALAFYQDHAIPIRRVLTDRGSTYRSKLFAQTCRELGLKHSFTRPYRPQTNGKAERFIQTLAREWAYARSYDSSDHRATFLPHFLHDYNFHRPHAALHHQPPSSRLPISADNVLRYDS